MRHAHTSFTQNRAAAQRSRPFQQGFVRGGQTHKTCRHRTRGRLLFHMQAQVKGRVGGSPAACSETPFRNKTFSVLLDNGKQLPPKNPTETKGDVIFCSGDFDCWLCDVCAKRLARPDENQAGGSRALALCAKCQPELQRRRGVPRDQPLKGADVVWEGLARV